MAWSLNASPVRSEARTLTLRQAIESAVQNNGELQAFRLEQGSREAAEVRAVLPVNPILDFEGSTGALTGSPHESSLALGVSQEFMPAGKRDKRLDSAHRDKEAFRWRVAVRERSLRDEVKTAWCALLLAEQRVALAEHSIALSRQLLNVAKERLAAGDIPELEFNLMNVELARSEVSRIAAAREVITCQARLRSLMGAPLSGQLTVAGDLAVTVPVVKSLAELQQAARSNRPDLKALESEKAKSDADIVLAQAERIPNVTAGLLFRRDSTSRELGGGGDTAYAIGLKLSVPIPVFDRNQAGIQEARGRKNSAETRLDAALAEIEREVATAYTAFQNAESVLSLYRNSILAQLEENLKLTQEAYRLGEVDVLAVIQEQKKFIEVNDGYLTALHDRQTAVVTLESAVGIELSGGAP